MYVFYKLYLMKVKTWLQSNLPQGHLVFASDTSFTLDMGDLLYILLCRTVY